MKLKQNKGPLNMSRLIMVRN